YRETWSTYDLDGNLVSQTVGISPDPNYAHVVTTNYQYDVDARLRRVLEGVNGVRADRVRTFGYNAVNMMVLSVDGRGVATTFDYDLRDRVTLKTEAANTALAREFGTVYDAVGNVIAEVDPLGRTTEKVYDPLNRMIRLIEAVGTPVQKYSI